MVHFSREIQDGDLHVLMISGELDISNREELRSALHGVDGRAPRVLIDFCNCRYFDTTALTELVRFYKARHPAQQLMLAMPEGLSRRILRVTAIDRLLPVVDCMHALAV
jgi:anti-anti-sigma factor